MAVPLRLEPAQGVERNTSKLFVQPRGALRRLCSQAEILYLLPVLLVSDPRSSSFTAVCLSHPIFPQVYTSNFWLA